MARDPVPAAPPAAPRLVSARGCLVYLGGPALLITGLSWTGVAVWLLASGATARRGGPHVPWILFAGGLTCLAVSWRLLRRAAAGRSPESGATLRIPDAAVSGGRSAMVEVAERELVLVTTEVRRWVAVLGAIALGAYVAGMLQNVFAGLPGGPPPVVWLYYAFPLFYIGGNRQVRTTFPLDAFGAVSVDGKAITLHRRGGGRPPLTIATKSWHTQRLLDALRTGMPDALDAAPPAPAPAVRDETREMAEALAAWLPEDRSRTATMIGASLAGLSMLLGAFAEAGLVDTVMVDPRWLSVGALVVWLQDAATRAQRRIEAARVGEGGGTQRPLEVQVRHPRGDVLAWLWPWQRTGLHERDGRLVLEHRPVDVFDLAVLAGIAVLGGRLVLGGLSPLHAGAYLLLLLTSGYPRRHTVTEELLPESLRQLDDAGGRATLQIEDEDGLRAIVMRYGSGRGPHLVELVRRIAPDARVREPGWRRAS